jgi:hypothetical protein
MYAFVTKISKVTKIYLAFVTQVSVIYGDRQLQNSSETKLWIASI